MHVIVLRTTCFHSIRPQIALLRCAVAVASMEELRSAFDLAADGDTPRKLQDSGPAGLSVLLNAASFRVEVSKIEEWYLFNNWEQSKSFTWDEIQDLVRLLELTDPAASGTGTPKDAVPDDLFTDQEDSGDMAKLADLVAQRLEQKVFPLVTPTEAANPEEAAQLLTLSQGFEQVQIQSYLEKERELFLGSDVVSPEMPECMSA